ncbi:MAG: A/G-specific adenine glycosylase [Pleurocapsa minor GSE-CHR-MK-17-07R]|jgi:A/G-specific adenine glycosylase|nr:A/G-specific adenine glycosylase [Pleurocapsa minor GSE-CHR-MK 17-07R]
MTESLSPHFSADLLAWYDAQAVALPWRTPGLADDAYPYRVWLSEIMLQQTQVETVRPYFARFMAAYPTVNDLAAAPLDDVLKLWEGLGYYSRARNLHRAAQMVASEFGGRFPASVEGLLRLPGIGRYTAGAIASIAFGLREPLVDGNVIRVYARLLDIPDDVTQPRVQARFWEIAGQTLPEQRAGDFNQALMDLGRLVCTPRSPDCVSCPVQAHCLALERGTQAERPVKPRRAPTPHYEVTAGIIWNEAGQVLIAQRPHDGLLGGLWEFPGGKQEAGESLPECLMRELHEELAISVRVGEEFVVVKHAFTHFKITLHAFTCAYLGPDDGIAPQTLGCAAWVWVRPDELSRFSFGKADRQVIAALEARRGMLL